MASVQPQVENLVLNILSVVTNSSHLVRLDLAVYYTLPITGEMSSVCLWLQCLYWWRVRADLSDLCICWHNTPRKSLYIITQQPGIFYSYVTNLYWPYSTCHQFVPTLLDRKWQRANGIAYWPTAQGQNAISVTVYKIPPPFWRWGVLVQRFHCTISLYQCKGSL